MKKLLVALVALLIAASPAFAEEAKELNVFSWSEYIPQEVVNGFTKETGIKVVLSTYESNEAMYAKLKLLGAKGYDLVVPSGYFVEVMAQDNLLAKLDKSKIKGLDNLDPASLNQPFDKGNALTIPYMWGTVGLLVNKKAVDVSTIKSWKDLARPEFKGRVLLSDDLRDTFGVGLKACGYSINSTNPDEIKAAYEWLKALKPSVRVFDVTATKQAFISGGRAGVERRRLHRHAGKPRPRIHRARRRDDDLARQLRHPRRGRAQGKRLQVHQLPDASRGCQAVRGRVQLLHAEQGRREDP